MMYNGIAYLRQYHGIIFVLLVMGSCARTFCDVLGKPRLPVLSGGEK